MKKKTVNYFLCFALTFSTKVWAQLYAPEIKVQDTGGKYEIKQTVSSSETLDLSLYLNNTNTYGFQAVRVGNASLHRFNSDWNYPSVAMYEANATGFYDHSGAMNIGAKGNFKIFTGGNSIGNERLRITESGNIGIGTTSPSDKLSVVSSVGHDIFSISRISTSNANTFDFRISSNVNGSDQLVSRSLSIVATDYAADIALLANPALSVPQFVLKSSGNVGIGTTNPGNYKLNVSGQVWATTYVAQSPPWADFVFKPAYQLLSLQEVEQFIHSHGHLPDIPSEVEVKKNGINLAEMDAKLLQKIEELTLYLIEQEKRLQKMEQENNALRQKVMNLEADK